MISRLRHILLTGFVLLSSFRLMGQLPMPDNVCVGETKRYNVEVNPVPGSTYTWRIDGEIQSGFPTNELIHTWNTAGTYLLEVQERTADGCLGPVRSGQVFVNLRLIPVFAAAPSYCSGAIIPALPETSINGIHGTWAPAINNTSTTTYTFTPDEGQCALPATLTVTISDNIVPAFAAIGTYCSGATIPALPLTSTNGITGTWAPAINNASTTTYTFTPDEGQCALPATLTVTVNDNIVPAFATVGPYCSGATIPALPLTSTNGITGTWAPAINNTATTTYTFTPGEGQCASTATMDIVVTASITPAFSQLGPICQNGTAPALPLTSSNNITGTWSPATINTAAVGTTTYTFTPDEGQCASTATMDIVVTASITPAFSQVGPICQNGTALALPLTSSNNTTGTWNPAAINTAAVGTTTYTFTPNEGQCASTATMDIVVTASITPAFAQIGPICQNGTVPALPLTSSNNITGTWNPAAINTAAVGTTTYMFTPGEG
ncbi:MAG TPA: hypothetical protein VK155_19900, partial [Bacteroidales bacterium]|nr:hypothetical protein [Bacteroidales bacterium]